ncbi:MAG: type 1 glutamine amidotransferase, partial [Myxococcota bacterium]|nr:type 1 glutamine amidotransferase [Myxococcota bacterium]
THAPPGCTSLAHTPACCHAFRVHNRPFWAFQFHPELDRQRYIERLGIFRDRYTETDEQYQRTIEQFQETPDSNALVRRFVEWVGQRK